MMINWKEYYNPLIGLSLRRGSRGVRVYADSENCGLWLAIYKVLQAGTLEEKELERCLFEVFRNRRATPLNGGEYVDGLYDRGMGESLAGQSCNETEHARTTSRDEMMAACSIPEFARDITNMFFRSMNRFPNHYVESLRKLEFTKNYWRNFQFQFLWDLSFYALRSSSKLHNVLGWLLFPLYYLVQFSIPLQKTVTRNGNEIQPKNSGDQLFVLRDHYLKQYKVYRFVRKPLIHLYKKKWGTDWKHNAVYNFHRCYFPNTTKFMRNHDFPITQLLEQKYGKGEKEWSLPL